MKTPVSRVLFFISANEDFTGVFRMKDITVIKFDFHNPILWLQNSFFRSKFFVEQNLDFVLGRKKQRLDDDDDEF